MAGYTQNQTEALRICERRLHRAGCNILDECGETLLLCVDGIEDGRPRQGSLVRKIEPARTQ
jgi:hypothetical protein